MSTQQTRINATKVLIVEDEVLIADTIRMNLERNGYRVTDNVISYEAAVASVKKTLPDVVLLDIRLNGSRTGVDVADFLRKLPAPPPFIYLTSQMDEYYLELAKQTYPAAYLGKPIQLNSLLATLKMVSFNAETFKKPGESIELRHQGVCHVIQVADICYLQSEHVYVRVTLTDGRTLLERGTFDGILSKINNNRFVQVHRSYVVNLSRVTGHDTSSLYFGKTRIPVSRSRREVLDLLGEA